VSRMKIKNSKGGGEVRHRGEAGNPQERTVRSWGYDYREENRDSTQQRRRRKGGRSEKGTRRRGTGDVKRGCDFPSKADGEKTKRREGGKKIH